MLRTKCSFTSYCTELSRKYQTSNVLSGPFMSVKTFISWFFGWISAFRIDFRREVDPWCKDKPKMLACDGTHIGISMQNMKLNKPVTEPDLKDTILKPIHKRKDHLVIHPKDQRLHLKYLSKKYLKKLKPHEILPNDLECQRTADLLQHVNNKCPLPVYEILLLFTQQVQHQDILQCITHILYMMSGDVLCQLYFLLMGMIYFSQYAMMQ